MDHVWSRAEGLHAASRGTLDPDGGALGLLDWPIMLSRAAVCIVGRHSTKSREKGQAQGGVSDDRYSVRSDTLGILPSPAPFWNTAILTLEVAISSDGLRSHAADANPSSSRHLPGKRRLQTHHSCKRLRVPSMPPAHLICVAPSQRKAPPALSYFPPSRYALLLDK